MNNSRETVLTGCISTVNLGWWTSWPCTAQPPPPSTSPSPSPSPPPPPRSLQHSYCKTFAMLLWTANTISLTKPLPLPPPMTPSTPTPTPLTHFLCWSDSVWSDANCCAAAVESPPQAQRAAQGLTHSWTKWEDPLSLSVCVYELPTAECVWMHDISCDCRVWERLWKCISDKTTGWELNKTKAQINM